MALKKHPLQALENFLPENTFDLVVVYLHQYGIKLSIKKDRKSVYGDFRPAQNGLPHRISVNGGLNKYHFLITLIHEVAHLVTFETHKQMVKAHGIEWKKNFALLLKVFLEQKVFPSDVLSALENSLHNLKASSCSDPKLALALKKYDPSASGTLIQDLMPGEFFTTSDDREFRLLRKRRTRFEAENIATKQVYLFPALFEVKKR